MWNWGLQSVHNSFSATPSPHTFPLLQQRSSPWTTVLQEKTASRGEDSTLKQFLPLACSCTRSSPQAAVPSWSLLHCGPLHRPQVPSLACSHSSPQAAGKYTCYSTQSTSSPSFFLTLLSARLFLIPPLPSPLSYAHCCTVFLPFLKFVFTEVPSASMTASVLASSGSFTELARTSSVQHMGSPMSLLTEATPTAPPHQNLAINPTHVNDIKDRVYIRTYELA